MDDVEKITAGHGRVDLFGFARDDGAGLRWGGGLDAQAHLRGGWSLFAQGTAERSSAGTQLDALAGVRFRW